ncbi:MAG: hypothetical protein ACOYLX_00050 [Burkholderiaceae bacterium]
MEKDIRNFKIRMAVVAIAVGILAIWQADFLWHGIKYNPYVNGAIILTTIAAIAIAFINVGKLTNEIVAFKALQEMWSDARAAPDMRATDPFWRHYRCLEPGKVFYQPKILGHVYDLVTEEIARTGKFSITVDTMNTLVDKIDYKVAEEKSLLTYLSGLLVFMGLVGTFMGLLAMVGSIGGILSSLQATGSGGTEGFSKLLGDLQAPLGGMATGFAASLFGLGGSLVVGMLARFTHQAAGVLKREFEAWLAAVAQIDKLHADAPATIVRDTLQPRVTELLARIVADYGKSVRGLEQSTELLSRLTDSSTQSIRAIESLNGEIARLAAEQATLRAELQTLSAVAPAIEKLTGTVETTTRTTAERAEAAAAELAQSLSRIERTQSEALISVVGRQSETSVHTLAAVDRGLGRLDSMLDGLQAAQNTTQRTLATIQNDTIHGLAAIADRHVAAMTTLAGSVERSQAQTQQVLADLRHDATLSLTQIADRHTASVGTLVGSVERTQTETQRLLASHQQTLATVVSAATETLAKSATPAIDVTGQTQALEAATRELSASVAEFCAAANMDRHAGPTEAAITSEALARIGKAVEMLSDRQLDDNATTQMLAAVDRSMSRGFGEIARAIEAALSTYADVIAFSAVEAPGAAETTPPVEPAADAEPEVTTTAFLRSLTANAGRAG